MIRSRRVSSPPLRPASVPADAVYLAATEEWSVGAVDGDGQPSGPYRYYRPNGTLSLECLYQKGVLEGPFRRLHPNGEIARRGEYTQGLLHGKVEAFGCRDPSPEALRSCCVPPGAYRLEAEYVLGSLAGECFYNERGQKILHDGTIYPAKPSHLPAEAALDEFSKRWYVRRFTETGELDGPFRSWSANGTPIEEATFTCGKRHGLCRLFSETGELREEAHYQNGLYSGTFRRILPFPSIYADQRIREERGTMSNDLATGEWQFLDEQGRTVLTADLGIARGEALCGLARAAAISNDREGLLAALDAARPPLLPEEAAAVAEQAVGKAGGDANVLLGALLRGGDPASLFRSIASSSALATRASRELVDAAILLAPDRDECRVTRILIDLSMGDPEGAEEDASRLGALHQEQRDSLMSYRRVLFPTFDFWPARVRFDSPLAEMPEEPCQPLSRFRETIQKYATRLQLLRGAVCKQVGGETRWQLPDLSSLLHHGPLPLERRTFEIEIDEQEAHEPQALPEESEACSVERIAVDETLSLAGLDVRSLMRLARSDWNALTWLCWSAGLDRVVLPDRLAPPADFGQAVGMAIERQWRARDRLTSHGLVALTKGVRGFEWEGMPIDVMPTFLVEIADHEYTDLRAMFFFLCDDRQESPWQDNLG